MKLNPDDIVVCLACGAEHSATDKWIDRFEEIPIKEVYCLWCGEKDCLEIRPPPARRH